MNNGVRFEMFRHARIKQLLAFIGITSAAIAFLHLFSHPGNYLLLSRADVRVVSPTTALLNISVLEDSKSGKDENSGDNALISDDLGNTDYKLGFSKSNYSVETNMSLVHDEDSGDNALISDDLGNTDYKLGFSTSNYSVETNMSLVHDNQTNVNSSSKSENIDILQDRSIFSSSSSSVANVPILRKGAEKDHVSITRMNTILLNNFAVKSKRPKRYSSRDQELQHAKLQIENASIDRKISEIHASLFRNYSVFKRSYELMESTLKVYVYREGEKPIFHQPYLRGIYASEGWFMKLMERNKQFVTKDPKKAHLFYLPFSSLKLRNASGLSQKNMESHLKNYTDLIASKYRFWNNRRGSDHFLVACHDWAPRLTRNVFGDCIRVLCNSNIARGFKIGKDVSLPVTYIRSSENPVKDLGGNYPSNRPILAFFAGGMHGNVRPILLKHWQNKEPDMKITGPMPRDIESKARYRELMKSSKYCISVKGYEVHTPRVVESIYYECVPVIISDNYVPPFFEVLNWESFAVFIFENDIPNLREILVSIPEDRYMIMWRRVKEVQRYFLWHKIPVTFDLFHMTLHSVWFNRVFQ